MMRTLAVVRQYLAAAFLLVIGLIAYGCGDSATVNPEATLANLTVTIGTDTATLQPAFNPATTSYTVDLSNNVTTVTVSAQPAVAGDNVTIDGQAATSRVIDLGPPVPAGSTTLVSVTVSDPPNTPRTYTVLLRRAPLDGNNSLRSMTVSPGTLNPEFAAVTEDYTVEVPNSVGSIALTPTLDDANATMTLNGQAATSGQARSITLNGPGSSTRVDIVVTAQNNTTKTYTVLVNRGGLSSNNNLQNLTVSPGPLTPPFNSNLQSYEVNVVNSVGSVSVTPTRQDPNATITVNGQATTSGQARPITLNGPGQLTTITIVVTAQNGNNKTYFVNVSRGVSGNNNLQSLAISPGTLSPSFSASTVGYTVNVASTVASVTVTPTRQDSNATITVNGQPATSGQAQTITLNGAGSNTLINIVVTAQNRTQKIYTVNVARAAPGGNNNLSALSVRAGTTTLSLSPSPFDLNILVYTGNVANNVTEVAVTATRQDANASITVNGQPTNSGAARTVTLIPAGQNQSTTTIPIIVTAQNSSQKTYTVNIIRAALGGNNNLQSLTVQSLNVPSHTLSPPFSQTRARTDYALDVDNNVGSITVNATPQDSGASVRILVNGAASGTNSISLPLGPSTTEIEIIVRAPNGTEKPYSITVDRAAASSNNNLSALSVRVGNIAQPLSPPFAAGTLAYTVNVASSVNEVTVAATKADRDATMAIGSVTVPPGTLTGETIVPVNTTLSIAVTAPSGGAPKTYTVTVNRTVAEPPPPTGAPDLIREDDTCPPGIPPAECAPDFNGNPTSREDNVTTVTRPRFSIPPPGVGETAKLYRDGVEEPSSFNPGDNTLRPNADFSDGSYNITYTLSNSGGESGESPPMTPQLRIDTTGP